MAIRGSIRTHTARPTRLRLHSTEPVLWWRPTETEPRPLAGWQPTVTPDERAWHAEPLSAASVGVSPAEAALGARASIARFDASAPRVVFAAAGSLLGTVSADDAMRVALEWSPAFATKGLVISLRRNAV